MKHVDRAGVAAAAAAAAAAACFASLQGLWVATVSTMRVVSLTSHVVVIQLGGEESGEEKR